MESVGCCRMMVSSVFRWEALERSLVGSAGCCHMVVLTVKCVSVGGVGEVSGGECWLLLHGGVKCVSVGGRWRGAWWGVLVVVAWWC